MNRLDGILNRDTLLGLTGERYFERGVEYHLDGRVRSLAAHGGTVAAKVLGTEEYRVRLWAGNGTLDYSCDCPLGMDGEFCKHCVAVGLAWLGEGGVVSDGPVTMDEVRAYLEGREKDELVGIIVEQAMEDDRLRERLLLRAARRGGGAPDTSALHQAIEQAVEPPGGYRDHRSPWDLARKLESIVESLADLLKEGFAAEAVESSEYAMSQIEEKAMDHDADGSVSGVLEALEMVHHAACLEARPDPVALARRLFEWEMSGHYDSFYRGVERYADVFGEDGLAEYRRLAGEE